MAIKISGNVVLTYDGANYSNTNIAVGYQALNANTTGVNNTAVGYQALYSNTTGSWGTAFGYQALYSNTTGTANGTAMGYQAQIGRAHV